MCARTDGTAQRTTSPRHKCTHNNMWNVWLFRGLARAGDGDGGPCRASMPCVLTFPPHQQQQQQCDSDSDCDCATMTTKSGEQRRARAQQERIRRHLRSRARAARNVTRPELFSMCVRACFFFFFGWRVYCLVARAVARARAQRCNYGGGGGAVPCACQPVSQ